jgi:hypothetical protein
LAGDDRTPCQGEKLELRLEGLAASSHPVGPPALWGVRLKHRLGRSQHGRPVARCSRSIKSGGLHE